VPLLTLDKLKRRVPEIVAAAVRLTQPLDDVLTCAPRGPADESAMAAPPPLDASDWLPLRVGDPWGGKPGADPLAQRTLDWGIPADGGSTHWLRATLRVPQDWRGAQVQLALAWSGQGQASLEAIVYLDGRALAGLDEFHRAILLPAAAHDGAHELRLRCYLPQAQPFGGLRLQLRDPSIFRLGHVMQALLAAVETYRESDTFRHTLLARLNAAYNLLDLRAGWQSPQFARSAGAALDLLMKDESRRTKDEAASSSLHPESCASTIVATGHAHLDVAWLWPLWRTRQKVAHTVASALHLMERYPDYHFSMSQPQVYSYLKRDDPELYERLRQRVAEGRFEPVGMMWLETDCNIPSGESLVRQLAHGARFFAEEFGALNHIVWLPDVFGYSAALPQLLRGCGIRCFMTTKISWNQFNRMPVDTFRWRGIDGSEVLTHFVTATSDPVRHPSDPQSYTYVGKMTAAEVFGTWNHYRQKAINDELLYCYGWGDGGGGPTEEMLEAAQVFGDLPGFPQVRLGRVEQFFERLYDRVWDDPDLPTWVGELYLEYHRGTYTSQSRTKQANRAAELRYREAEWLNAWAYTLGASNQQARLDAGWQLILLNQFHDILPGSSVALVYADSNAQYAEVQQFAQAVRADAIAFILTKDEGRRTKDGGRRTEDEGSTFVVFNSLPWDRRDVVRIALTGAEAGAEAPQLVDAAGATLPAQLVEEAPGEHALLVAVGVPAYGYTALTAGHADTEISGQGEREMPQADQSLSQSQQAPLVVGRSSLENGELRLELDDNGEIASLYDLRHGREVLAPGARGNQLVAYEDRPLNWDAWDIDSFYEQKPYPLHDIRDWRVVEARPLRAVIAITRQLGHSTIQQRICLWRDSRRVDFVTEVDWQERQTLLRALFPLAINATQATCEIQFGAAERPTHRNTSWDSARFEVCAQRWVDLSEGGYGVALLNDGKYGHSLHNSILGLSLLKGGIHPDPDADRGRHRFTYSLLPHAGDWRAAQVVRRAYELNAPLFVTKDERRRTKDRASEEASFVSTSTDHIVVETVKVADDGDGLIVRLYEAHNQRGPASLVFARPVAQAVEVDLLERAIGPVAVADNRVSFDVRPFEVKTLRVRL
jgi:alpha-mannosidase